MANLVAVQTLRGNAGVDEAIKAVQAAVDKYNAANPDGQHAVHTFVALPPNVKGMQVQLSLWSVLARTHGATLIRLNVHNGNVALCGPQAAIDKVLAEFVPTYNAMVTLAAATYKPAEHGPRMGFNNGFLCGLTAGMDGTPATLAYGLGGLFNFPMPGNGSAYELGAKARVAKATEVTATEVPAKPRQRKTAA